MDRVGEEIIRRAEDTVVRRMRTTPVVVLHGARTVGKSTLLRALARRFDRPVGDLDQRSTRDVAKATPSFYVQGDPPVFIDEYQHVPELLDAIKAELEPGCHPGPVRDHGIDQLHHDPAGGPVPDRPSRRAADLAAVAGGA